MRETRGSYLIFSFFLVRGNSTLSSSSVVSGNGTQAGEKGEKRESAEVEKRRQRERGRGGGTGERNRGLSATCCSLLLIGGNWSSPHCSLLLFRDKIQVNFKFSE